MPGSSSSPARVPGALRASRGALGALAERGIVYVQDAGSQLVARLAAGAGRVLDACAAPGRQGAAARGPRPKAAARVVAAEASRRRLGAMATLARRWGATRLLLAGGRRAAPSLRARTSTPSCSTPRAAASAPSRATPTSAGALDSAGRRAAGRAPALAARRRSPARAPAGPARLRDLLARARGDAQVVDAFLAANPAFSVDELPDWARPYARDGRIELGPRAPPRRRLLRRALARVVRLS